MILVVPVRRLVGMKMLSLSPVILLIDFCVVDFRKKTEVFALLRLGLKLWSLCHPELAISKSFVELS